MFNFSSFKILASSSEISTDVVPTSTGLPEFESSVISITALYFSLLVL